jgi:aminoglycoside/choline kinase family phosphotransferase
LTGVTFDLTTRVETYLRQAGLEGATLAFLTPDASDRRYVRVTPRSGASLVLAVHSGPIDFERLPFANVASLLSAMPVPVPRILGHSDPLGVVALEDLGDVTLQAHLESTARADLAARYREAVGHIATIQRRGHELAGDRFLPYGLAFDVPKLMFELDFFVTHFAEGHRQANLPAPARAALGEEFARLASELADEPRVVCHRDYHSRNLMVRHGTLAIIDFQDARMGPDTYDLASLLRDSYVALDGHFVEELIAYFLSLDRGPLGHRGSHASFRTRFDTMAVQRNLKALGTFGYQASKRGNTGYLRDVPRTLGYLRVTFDQQPRFARLRELLAPALPELA